MTTSVDNFSFFLPISKIDKERRTVSGYCSTPALDLDGEIVSLDALKKAAPGYWEWRNIRRMHSADAVGVGKELNIDEKGAFLTAKIVDTDAWNKCLEGVYKGFSIGGKKLGKVGNTITEIEWIETSIVDRPANPECKFDVAKSAKAVDGSGGYLLKAASVRRDPRDRAMAKMAQAVEALAKADDRGEVLVPPEPLRPTTAKEAGGPPVKCAVHGAEDCKVCKKAAKKAAKKAMKKNGLTIEHEHGKELKVTEGEPTTKRDVGRKERESLASQGKALPGGGFPIKNKDDLDNARRAIGRAKNPSAARTLIRRRARELGVSLPDNWSKKLAKSLIAAAEAERLRLGTASPSSFLDLKKAEGSAVGPGLLSPESGNDDTGDGDVLASIEDFLTLNPRKMVRSGGLDLGDVKMAAVANGAANGGQLDEVILDILKRASSPTRAQRMEMARGNMKKAAEARKAARSAIEDAHKMHKTAYLSKAAKKPKSGEPDADDFDHAGAMEKLQKAYGELEKLGTFVKAAREQLKKLGRSGQRGQEAGDSEGGFYEVPAGVKDLTPDAMSGAKPGTSGSTGVAPAYPGSEGISPSATYSGKLAKFVRKGLVSAEVAELLAENARLEGQNATLARLPVGNGRRPYSFDMTKLGGAAATDDPIAKAIAASGVSPAALMRDNFDEGGQEDPVKKAAVAAVAGNYLLGSGKSIFDPGFRGGVVGRQ